MPLSHRRWCQHCREAVYTHFLETFPVTRAYRLQRLAWRRQFVERWPELHIWVAAPLALRVGRLPGERRGRLTDRVCYRARHYLLFLALRGFIRLDYAWLLGAGRLHVDTLARQLGITLGIDALIAEAVRLGFDRGAATEGMQWCVSRLAVHTGLLAVAQFRMAHLAELLDAIRRTTSTPPSHSFIPALSAIVPRPVNIGLRRSPSSRRCCSTAANSSKNPEADART